GGVPKDRCPTDGSTGDRAGRRRGRSFTPARLDDHSPDGGRSRAGAADFSTVALASRRDESEAGDDAAGVIDGNERRLPGCRGRGRHHATIGPRAFRTALSLLVQTALNYLHTFAQVLIYLFIAAIILRALAWWFVRGYRGLLLGFLFYVAEPVLSPLRWMVPTGLVRRFC